MKRSAIMTAAASLLVFLCGCSNPTQNRLSRKPEGKIKENLGNIRTPGTDILAIVKSFGIPSEFPEKVIQQAQRVPDHVLDADRDGRLDLTHLQTVTIDGEDEKDMDDAISHIKDGGIYHLGVQNADVSNYVQ